MTMRLSSAPLVGLAALLIGALFTTGCNYFARRNDPAGAGNRVAIALTVNGSEQPSPQLWANLVRTIEPELAVYGLVLVDDLALADRILRIDVTPSPTNPNSGQVVVLGWRTNPLRGITYAGTGGSSAYRTSYNWGLSTYYSSNFGYERYSDYGYLPGYAGVSPGAPTTAPANPPGKPPPAETRHGDRPPGSTKPAEPRHGDRPPGTTKPVEGGRGRYAGGELPRHPDQRYHRAPSASVPSSTAPSSVSSSSSSSASSSSSSGYSGSSASYSSGSSGSSGSSSGGSSAGGGSSGGQTTRTTQPN